MKTSRFMRINIITLSRLLNMLYKPSEIAELIGVTTETVYRSYLPAGAPFKKDDKGNVLIHGLEFASWAKGVFQSKKMGTMELNQAWCCKCKRATEIKRPIPVKITRYVTMLQGNCSECGTRVNRAISPTNSPRKDIKYIPKNKPYPVTEKYINRNNWIEINNYIKYLEKLGQHSEDSIKRIRTSLRHLLEWALDVPLYKAKEIEPSLLIYLQSARNDAIDKKLSFVSIDKVLTYSRMFFEYSRLEYPSRYKAISTLWIEQQRPPRSMKYASQEGIHEFYTIEMMQKIASYQPKTLREERDRAAACFLFLSAMRSKAFVSLPVFCVNLEKHTVNQKPALGVRTKNQKASETQLLRIPELMEVVKSWDNKLRAAGFEKNGGLWFPPFDMNGEIEPDNTLNWSSRSYILAKCIKKLCLAVGIEYLSPHKFRHGHAIYMGKMVTNMQGYKAVSQNLMHSSISTTDGIYGRLISDDIFDVYEKAGKVTNQKNISLLRRKDNQNA